MIEALQDTNLPTKPTEAFAFSTARAFHIPPTHVHKLEGATEIALAASQKLAAQLRNRGSSRKHEPFLHILVTKCPDYLDFANNY